MKNLTTNFLLYLKENNLKSFDSNKITYLCENHWGTELISISHSIRGERTPFGVFPVDVLEFKTDKCQKCLSQVDINKYEIKLDISNTF